MNRRGFLGSILAACAAPAIVRADSLMRIVSMETVVATVYPPAVDFEFATGNTLLTIDQITREALRIFEQQMQFTTRMDANFIDAFRDLDTPRIINIRRPERFA